MDARRRLVGRAWFWLAVAAVAVTAGVCGAAEPATRVEIAHLVPERKDALVATYTLEDETRPLLAAPAETVVPLQVPSSPPERFTFDVPSTVPSGEVIAVGTYGREQRTWPIAAQRLTVSEENGARRATFVVPPLARGPGPPTNMTLTLTAPPTTDVVETTAALRPQPRGAMLHFAYALSAAAAVPGGGPVTLEVATRDDAASPLWSKVLDPAQAETRRWREESVPLDALAGRPAELVFRARASAGARTTLLPVWGDPTVSVSMPRNPKRRNVILISLDTLRADRIGVYGAYRPTTPAIDAWARESVVFTDAWSVWPETSGSHMSIFTSRFPSEHGVQGFVNVPPRSITLLAEHLRHAGYATRAFTEDGGVWANAGFARGFAAYGERRSRSSVYRGEAAATFGDATHWLESHADRSFFLFVHTYQVHAPYTPPPGYTTLFADMPGHESFGQWANALNYDRETRFTDDQVGPFLAAVRRLGLADRTIIVLLADHGEEFAEHGGMGHGRTLHREVLQVPFILSAPGLLAAQRVTGSVSMLDVAPTVLDLLGLPGDPGHRGRSLAAVARARGPAPSRPIFGEVDRDDLMVRDHPRAVSVRQAGRAAITNLVDHTTRCYAADDPAEQHAQSECPDLTKLLATHVAAMTRRTAAVSTPVPADPRTIEKMRALGYVQ